MAVCEVLLPTSVAKPEHVALVQLRRVRGRQVVADDDARLLEVAQVRFLLQAQQIVQHARRHVAHVGGALPQVIVLDGRQGGGVALGDGVEGVLGVDLLLLDDAHDLVDQRAVFEHEQVGVEDAAFLGAHAFADLALDLQDLVAGLDQGLLQAIDFLGQRGVGQLQLGDGRTGAAQHENLPTAYSGRDRYAPEALLSTLLRLWHE